VSDRTLNLTVRAYAAASGQDPPAADGVAKLAVVLSEVDAGTKTLVEPCAGEGRPPSLIKCWRHLGAVHRMSCNAARKLAFLSVEAAWWAVASADAPAIAVV
jgi:hypothetical protein